MRLARTLQVSTLFALVLPLNAHIHPDLSPFLGSSVEASLDASSFGSPEERLHGNKARTGSNVPHGTSHDEHRIMRQIVRRALDSTSKIVRHDAEQARRNNELKRKQTRRQLRQLRLTNASTGELSNQVHKDAWEQVKNLRKKVATKDNLKGKQKAQGRMLHLSGRSSVKQARRVKKYIQMKVPKAQAKLRQGQRQQAQAQMVQMVKSAGNKKLLIPMHKSRLKKTELKLQQLAQRLLLVQHQSRVAEQNVAISHSLKYSIHSAKQGLSRSQHSISRIRQLMRSLKKKRKRIVARLQTFKNQSIEDTALDKQVAKSISVNVNQQLSSLQEQVVALGNSSATLSNGSNRFNTRLAKVSGTKVPGVDSKVIHAAATLAKSMKNAKPSPRKKLIQNVVFHTKNLQTQMVEDKWRRQQQTSPLEEEIQDVTIVIDHAQETQKKFPTGERKTLSACGTPAFVESG